MPNKLRRSINVHRRLLLKGLGAVPLGLSMSPAFAAPTDPECELSFLHTHTDERLNIVYRSEGAYVPGALARINHLLRDFRTGDVAVIDPRLLDILYALAKSCGGETFQIISGYRSPATNAMLRKTGGGGVAKHSLHMEGRAIDVRLTGRDTAHLHHAALALRAGGVGYYPSLDFVHVDTGRVRHWKG